MLKECRGAPSSSCHINPLGAPNGNVSLRRLLWWCCGVRCGAVIRKNAATRKINGRQTSVKRLLSCVNNSRKPNRSFRAHESSVKTRPAASSQVTTTRTSSFGQLTVNVSFAIRATRLISDLPSKKCWVVQPSVCPKIVTETSSSKSMFPVPVLSPSNLPLSFSNLFRTPSFHLSPPRSLLFTS